MLFFTFVIAAATLVQGGTSIYQWRVANRALDANERAWLIGTFSGLTISPKEGVTLNTRVGNYGKSPAFAISTGIGHTWTRSMPSGRIPVTEDTVEYTLPPGQGHQIPGSGRVPDISESEIKEVLSGKVMFLWFRIEYSDPYSDERYSVECWKYDAAHGGLSHCPRGSSAHR